MGQRDVDGYSIYHSSHSGSLWQLIALRFKRNDKAVLIVGDNSKKTKFIDDLVKKTFLIKSYTMIVGKYQNFQMKSG
jgi:acid phosphatase class B